MAACIIAPPDATSTSACGLLIRRARVGATRNNPKPPPPARCRAQRQGPYASRPGPPGPHRTPADARFETHPMFDRMPHRSPAPRGVLRGRPNLHGHTIAAGGTLAKAKPPQEGRNRDGCNRLCVRKHQSATSDIARSEENHRRTRCTDTRPASLPPAIFPTGNNCTVSRE